MGRLEILSNYIEKQTSIKSEGLKDSLVSNVSISIVIPVFNEEYNLPYLFNSLEKQKYRGFEVLVVDNGSSDKSLDIISFSQKHVSFKLLLTQELKPGIGNARKLGMDTVVKRAFDSDAGKEKHIILMTDADTTFPETWTESVHVGFLTIPSGGLTGTHGVNVSVDKKIETSLGLKDYFNKIPMIIEWLRHKNIGRLKMNGVNSAFEIETYCASGGMQQSKDIIGKTIIEGTASLGYRASKNGYPLRPMGSRIFSSRRRHLSELLNGKSMYIDGSYNDRIYSIHEDESVLLNKALDEIPINFWKEYQLKIIENVLNDVILIPAKYDNGVKESVCMLLGHKDGEDFRIELNKEQNGRLLTKKFITKWTKKVLDIFEKSSNLT